MSTDLRRWSIIETHIVRGFAYLAYRGEVTKYEACKDLKCIFGSRTEASIYSKLQRELKSCA